MGAPPKKTDLSKVSSKVGSLDYAKHTPGTLSSSFLLPSREGMVGIGEGGGEKKIVSKRTDFSSVKAKVPARDNLAHKPAGGDKKVRFILLSSAPSGYCGRMGYFGPYLSARLIRW